MSKLVYRVHPIPRSLQQYVFDFGYLKPDQETQYIRAILVRHLGALRAKGHDVQKLDAMCALALLLASQAVVRDYENDPSAVSLRDAVRACELLDWFALRIMKRDDNKKAEAQTKSKSKAAKISPLAAALVLGLAFVYMYRLPHAQARKAYWDALLTALQGTRGGFHKNCRDNIGRAWNVLSVEDHGYGPDTARTSKQARELMRDFDESGFAEEVCAEHGGGGGCRDERSAQREPLRHVHLRAQPAAALHRRQAGHVQDADDAGPQQQPAGQPLPQPVLPRLSSDPHLCAAPSNPGCRDGMSADGFPQSDTNQSDPFLAVPYQCSPMSASNAIQHQFDIACRFQQHATSIVSVLLLDEVGLAEHSPDMPLKVLHAMLVKPPIAIVGLSNWTLDSAKMNRAICIQRTEPSPLDIELTANSIVGTPTAPAPSSKEPLRPERQGTNEQRAAWLKPVCSAYHSVYTSQQGRDFLGMRDLYACIKKLSASTRKGEHDLSSVEFAIMRNFGGKQAELHRVLVAFHSQRLH
eukprot:5754744-Prymnesium_polylepis.1